MINVWSPASESGQFGDLGVISVSLPDGGFSFLDFPSGMTQLGSDLYLLDGGTGSRRLFRFTSLQSGSVRAEEVGRYNNVFNSVTRRARCIAALNGDIYIGFNNGLLSKVDPNDVTRTGEGYGTLSVTAAGSGGVIWGMCAVDGDLLLSISGTNAGLWRINPNDYMANTPPYGLISTWANANVGRPIRSLVLV